MGSQTRERIVESTAELFRRQGYSATGMKQIAAEAAAPFGSLYHFFPGGKESLGAETIRTSGRLYTRLFAEVAMQHEDIVEAVAACFGSAAQTLLETGYEDACPIATVALEVSSTSEPLRLATAEVFTEWIDGATAWFAGAGIDGRKARELAFVMLNLLEGAFVFARSLRSTEPLEHAGRAAAAAVAQALGREQAR